MKAFEIMEGESWLQGQQRKDAEKLVADFPVVEPGMFVQLNSWFGDIWAEITSAYQSSENPTQRSVNFVRYDKYGVERKEDHAYYGYIRKFATRDQIDFKHTTVFTPDACYRHGTVVEWPKGPHRRDRGGYELHPTEKKPERR